MAALLVVVERTGKSLRGPARDVLLSEATSKVGHGWGFGVHAAMDQTGAVVGPLLMAAGGGAVAALRPGLPAAGVSGGGRAPRVAGGARDRIPAGKAAPRKTQQQNLPGVFWTYVAAAGVLACGFVDFPLLAYHFQKTGVVRPAIIPLLYAGAMGVNGLTALILGRLFDRHGIVILVYGTLVSLLALPLGFLGGEAGAVASVACWAAGLGAQDACLRSGIAQVVSMNKRRRRVRRIQRRVRRHMVPRQRPDGRALWRFPGSAGSFRSRGANGRRRAFPPAEKTPGSGDGAVTGRAHFPALGTSFTTSSSVSARMKLSK